MKGQQITNLTNKPKKKKGKKMGKKNGKNSANKNKDKEHIEINSKQQTDKSNETDTISLIKTKQYWVQLFNKYKTSTGNTTFKLNKIVPKSYIPFGRILIIGNDINMYQICKQIAPDVLTIGINRAFYLFWPHYLFINDLIVLEEIDELKCTVPKHTTIVFSDYTINNETKKGYNHSKKLFSLIQKYNVVIHKRNYKSTHVFTFLHTIDTLIDIPTDKITPLEVYISGVSLDSSKLEYAFYNKHTHMSSMNNQSRRLKVLLKHTKKNLNINVYKTNPDAFISCPYRSIKVLYDNPLHIVIVKKTRLAYAPDAIKQLLKLYTNITSELIIIDSKKNIQKEDKNKILNATKDNRINILHFNDKYISYNSTTDEKWPIFKAELIHIHSPPSLIDLNIPKHVHKFVLNQLHCTMALYKNFPTLMNPIVGKPLGYNIFRNEKENSIIRIAYSPSVTKDHGDPIRNKGYKETVEILKNIEKQYNSSVAIDIIVDVKLEDCILKKSMADIVIDECLTGGFHRSGLEGLALGKVVVGYICEELKNIHPTLPIISTKLSNLEKCLKNLITMGKDKLCDMGNDNKIWFENNWSNEIVAKKYVDVYNSLVKECENDICTKV